MLGKERLEKITQLLGELLGQNASSCPLGLSSDSAVVQAEF